MTLARCERCACYRPLEELYQEGTAGGFTRLEDRYWCVDLRGCERRERDGVGGATGALPYDRRQHRAGAWDCPKQVRDRLKKELVWRQNCSLMATSSGDPWVYPGTIRDLGPSVEDFKHEFGTLPGPDQFQWNDNFFTGEEPGGVLRANPLGPGDLERVREAWEERHQGYRRRNRATVLDAQFAAIDQITRDQILGAYGVPAAAVPSAAQVIEEHRKEWELHVPPRLARAYERWALPGV